MNTSNKRTSLRVARQVKRARGFGLEIFKITRRNREIPDLKKTLQKATPKQKLKIIYG